MSSDQVRPSTRSRFADDDGFAMAMAMAVAVIVFLLASMLVTIAVYRTQQSSIQRSQSSATHLADAGLNAYIAEMRFNPDYVARKNATGSTNLAGNQSNGSWSVSAVTDPGAAVATLTAIGVDSTGARRTLHARVTFKTFADYALCTTSSIGFTNTDIVNGDVRANGKITLNNGTRIYGKAEASSYSLGSGVGALPSYTQVSKGAFQVGDRLDFNQGTRNSNAMIAVSVAEGSRIATNTAGHLLIFGQPSADQVTIKTINTVDTNNNPGAMTFSSTTSMPYPPSGIFTFGDDVWVQGTYSRAVSV
jgi:Tfp pilus assembly protein PilX